MVQDKELIELVMEEFKDLLNILDRLIMKKQLVIIWLIDFRH